MENMNKTQHNILYIGPYLEESLRGSYARNIVKGLNKEGHKLDLVPIFSKVNQTIDKESLDENIKNLESNALDSYDICIQHCDPNSYVYSNKFKQNIGIYTPLTHDIDPITYSKLELLDKIIVNSSSAFQALSSIMLKTQIQYCPSFIDEDILFSDKLEKLKWVEKNKYYFYTELEFDEMHDWEKLIYVYLTSFNKDTSLIIKTKDLEIDETKVEMIHKQINLLAMDANIEPNSERMPKIMSGRYKDMGYANLINSIDCYIDVQCHVEPNDHAFLASKMGKAVIAHKYSELQNLKMTYSVDSFPVNKYQNHYDSLLFSSMYNYYYSLDSNSLREQMKLAYRDRLERPKIKKDSTFNVENINGAIC